MAHELLHAIKACSKCGVENPATTGFFHKQRSGLMARCKVCHLAASRAWRAAHPESQRAYSAAWAAANPESIKASNAKWSASNADRQKAVSKVWYESNREQREITKKAWNAANKDRTNELARKRRENPQYRLSAAISRGVYGWLRGAKAGRNTEKILGYSMADLRIHLERQFLAGMSWENYGCAWHVDHILPIASFTFQSVDDAEFKQCWAITNLRPLWAKANISKSSKRTLLI